MEICIYIMGGANAERMRELIADLRAGGVNPRERRQIRTFQRSARETPTMLQMQFMTVQTPTPQYYLTCAIPSSAESYTSITVSTEFDATMLQGCRARVSFGPDPEGRPLFREVVMEIPERGVNHREVAAFGGTGPPRANTYVEGFLWRYGS